MFQVKSNWKNANAMQKKEVGIEVSVAGQAADWPESKFAAVSAAKSWPGVLPWMFIVETH